MKVSPRLRDIYERRQYPKKILLYGKSHLLMLCNFALRNTNALHFAVDSGTKPTYEETLEQDLWEVCHLKASCLLGTIAGHTVDVL